MVTNPHWSLEPFRKAVKAKAKKILESRRRRRKEMMRNQTAAAEYEDEDYDEVDDDDDVGGGIIAQKADGTNKMLEKLQRDEQVGRR